LAFQTNKAFILPDLPLRFFHKAFIRFDAPCLLLPYQNPLFFYYNQKGSVCNRFCSSILASDDIFR
jgi:hypothetical protein